MTVEQKLSKITKLFRNSIFEEVAKSDLDRIKFTSVIDFNSQKELLDTLNESSHLNSYNNEINEINYIKINNTKLSVKETAKIIKEKFNL